MGSGRTRRHAGDATFTLADLEVLPALLVQPSVSANQTEAAYASIRRQIIELTLPPGGIFTEMKLATALGVSKTPVREALVRLHHVGLVEPVPRTGWAVSPVTLRSTRDLCEFRSVVEAAAAELAARRMRTPQPWAVAALARLEELAGTTLASPYASDKDGVERYLRDHFEFQAIIANLSGNVRLAKAIVGVLNDLERVLRLSLGELPWSDQRAEERQTLVAAIKSGDGAEARAMMLKRTTDAQTEILDTLMASTAVDNVAISPFA